MDVKSIGELGEKAAVLYLKKNGYLILDRNYRVGVVGGPQTGEIDIICKKKGVISFVEVKSSLKVSYDYFSPEDRVNIGKRKKIIRTAERWLINKKVPLDSPWQINVISVVFDPTKKQASISLFENIDSY